MQRLSNRIYDEILGSIRLELWKPGARVPSERNLCEMFRVSRPVIREALRMLEENGVVFVDTTRGTFVSSMSRDELPRDRAAKRKTDISFLDLVENRLAIELHGIELATQRRTIEDLNKLESYLAKMGKAFDDKSEFRAADVDFHCALAIATQSYIYPSCYQKVMSLALHSRHDVTSFAPVRKRILHCHATIYDAVKTGEIPTARQSVVAHIRQFVTDVRMGVEMGILPYQDTSAAETMLATFSH